MVEKTAGESGAAGKLHRKWRAWLASEHGSVAAARLAAGDCAPTIEETKRFSTWVFTTRCRYSCVGRKGCGDSYGALQIPYMLAKFVFPLMQYEGYVGLTVAQAACKNQEYCHELKEHWKSLKVQVPDATVVRAQIRTRGMVLGIGRREVMKRLVAGQDPHSAVAQ